MAVKLTGMTVGAGGSAASLVLGVQMVSMAVPPAKHRSLQRTHILVRIFHLKKSVCIARTATVIKWCLPAVVPRHLYSPEGKIYV